MRNLYFIVTLAAVLTLAGCAMSEPPPAVPASQAATAPTFAEVTAPPPRPKATGTPADARRHMIRGEAAIEMAKSAADLSLAADEFRMATEIEPTLASAWYDLGSVQSRIGRYNDAIDSYQHYLKLEPKASDAQKIRDELIKLQFQAEQQAKVEGRAGIWIADDGTLYGASVDGDRMTLHTDSRHVPESEVLSTYPLVGSVPIGAETDDYQLLIQGNGIKGVWSRPAMPADKCTIPAESAEVSGSLDDQEHTMVLRYVRTTYKAATGMSLLSDDYCMGVTATNRENVAMRLYGPLPNGGVGVPYYRDSGRFVVRVANGSPAYNAGLRDGDDVLTIDGVVANTLTVGQTVWLLRGAPGTQVKVTVARDGAAAPVAITLTRVKLYDAPKPRAQ